MLKVGDKAYPFKLNDQHGVERTLSEFSGKKVILYFYPKDNTPRVHQRGGGVQRPRG